MSSLIRAMSTGTDGGVLGQTTGVVRATGRLSDGTLAAIMNDGGLFCLYISPNGTTWTLAASIAANGGLNLFTNFSMCVGDNDNVHLAYRDSSGNIKYYKFVHGSGNSYSVGAVETIVGTTTSIGRIDIESPIADVVLVGGVDHNSPATVRFYIRHTGGAWVNFRNHQISNNAMSGHYSIAIARDSGNLDTTLKTCCFSAVYVTPDATVFTGDVIALNCKVNYQTGALVTAPTLVTNYYSSVPKGSFKDHWIYTCPANPGRWDIVTIQGRTSYTASICRVNQTGFQVNPVFSGNIRGNVVARGGTSQPYWLQTASAQSFDSILGGVGAGVVIWTGGWVGDGTTRTWSLYYHVDETRASWVAPNYAGLNADLWDAGDNNDQGVDYLYGGGNRNNQSGGGILTLAYDSNDKQMRAVTNLTQSPVPILSNPGTVTTNTPTLSSYLNPYANARYRLRPIFQVATSADFLTNGKTIVGDPFDANEYQAIKQPPTSGQWGSGSVTRTFFNEKVAQALALSQTTWYVRAAVIDPFGLRSSFSASQSFVVSHPPSATPTSPVNGVKSVFGSGAVKFSWKFSSPNSTSTQSAYRIVVENSVTGATVLDTNKVVSSAAEATHTLLAAADNVPLRWKIQVWDEDNISGNFSNYVTFQLVDASSINITTPTNGSTVNNPTPTVAWTFAPPSSDATVSQAKFKVNVTQGGTTKWDSGWQYANATSVAIPATAGLVNSQSYIVTVTVQDSNGIQSAQAITFSTSWTAPAAPTFALDGSTFTNFSYVNATWTNASKDANWAAWRVYRRKAGTTTPELVYETSLDTASYAYADYLAASGQAYEYSVVQVANRFGTPIESVYNWSTITPSSPDYWLIDPLTTQVIRLLNVTSDSYTEAYESQVYNVIGRGRKVDYGDRWGLDGSMTAKFYDDSTFTARQRKQQMETLKAARRNVYLKTPFGDTYSVAVGDLQVSRVAGVGLREFVEVTIPYQEVAV